MLGRLMQWFTQRLHTLFSPAAHDVPLHHVYPTTDEQLIREFRERIAQIKEDFEHQHDKRMRHRP